MPKVVVNESRCKGCGLCVGVCPEKLLRLSETRLNEKGFSPAGAERPDECIGCASCAVICPDVAITIEK